MKYEFNEYIESIGLTGNVITRISTIYEFYKEVCPEDIEEIFITDFLNDDKSRVYENLWFFSESYCMEAQDFINADTFDLIKLKNNILRWEIKKNDYDFKKATEKSLLYLKFRATDTITGELKASKENCDYLKDIMLKYVIPNLK